MTRRAISGLALLLALAASCLASQTAATAPRTWQPLDGSRSLRPLSLTAATSGAPSVSRAPYSPAPDWQRASRAAADSAPERSPGPAASAPAPKPHASPRDSARTAVSGTASWYAAPSGVAAAGPALRAALGPSWRGREVLACAAVCVRVRLLDWCACVVGGSERLIDLPAPDFARLAPLSAGLVGMEVREP